MPSGVEDLYNLFWRHTDGTYSLINAAKPTEIPPSSCEECLQILDALSFAGASNDFSHILFETATMPSKEPAPPRFPGESV